MTTAQMLDERYGRRSGPRSTRFWIVFGAIGVSVIVAGAAWFAFSSGTTTEASTTGFEIVDDHTVTVSFQVSAPTGRSVACVLEAQDEEHGVVGWKVVEYPATDDHTQAFQESIPITAPATTGFVNNCWVS